MKAFKLASQRLASSLIWIVIQSFGDARQPKALVLEVAGNGNRADITVHGQAGRLYEIATSTDLKRWTHHSYAASNGAPLNLSFLTAGFPSRFFAAWEYKPLASSATLDYVASGLAFYPDRWVANDVNPSMSVFRGKEIAFLANDDWFPGDFNPLVMSTIVDKMDRGWAYYREVTGISPWHFKSWDGLPVIAAIPHHWNLSCGYGCGYIGATGVELAGFYQTNYPLVAADPNAFDHYIFYEMGRNFYSFGDRHSLFLTGFAVFMRYMCMDHMGLTDPDLHTRLTLVRREADYAASPAVDWYAAFTGPGGGRLPDGQGGFLPLSGPTDLYASIMLALVKEHGEAFLMRFYRELATCPEFSHETPEGQLGQALNMASAVCVAARTNEAPRLIDRWKFPLGDAVREGLASTPWDGSVSAADLVLRLYPHFTSTPVANHSFESALDSWEVSGWKNTGGRAAATNETSSDGASSLRLQAPAGDPNVLFCAQTVDVLPDTPYHFSARVRTSGVVFEESGRHGAFIDVQGMTRSSPSLSGNNDWTRVSATFTTGANQTSATLVMRLGDWSSAVSGKAWFDSVELRAISP